MRYILKYSDGTFFKICKNRIYYGSWARQTWGRETKIINAKNITLSLIINEAEDSIFFLKDNKRFINEAFKYLIEKYNGY